MYLQEKKPKNPEKTPNNLRMTKRTVLRLYKSRTSPVTIQSISQIFKGNKNEVSSAGDFPGPMFGHCRRHRFSHQFSMDRK